MRRTVDHALRWRGAPIAGAPLLRIAHFGDCGWREMPRSHGVHNPPGYPRVIAERLAAAGIGIEFSSVVAGQFEHLPRHGRLDVHLKLTGEPDVALVQLGTMYSRMVVLPDTPRVLRTRAAVGRALGPAVFAAYRPLRPVVNGCGRFAVPYRGAADLAGFLWLARARWPAARLLLIQPFPRACASARRRERERRVMEDTAAVAAGTGVELLDLGALVPPNERGLRCANGYNLNARGSQLVGERLADWVLAGAAAPAPF